MTHASNRGAGLVEGFVANPVKVAVGVLLLTLFGVIALDRMPMQLTPEVRRPSLTIETRWPGGSPQEVEREIVQEQEEQLKGVEGLTSLKSESMDSQGRLTLEFLVGTDMSKALLTVNSRLQQVREYPEEADEPVITTASSSDNPIAWFILAQALPEESEIRAFRDAHPETAPELDAALRADSHGLRLSRLRAAAAKHPVVGQLLPADLEIPKQQRFAENIIESRFERVPGISNASVLGGREEEVQVVLDPHKLAARGLTVADVRTALRGRNRDTSAGDFWEGKRRYVVRTLGQFKDVDEITRVLLARRDGAPVYIGDVGEVRLTHKKRTGFVKNFGETCIAINARRESGANVLDAMEGLREAVRELNASRLADRGLYLKQVYDETDYIYSAVGLVNQNIVVGGFLTIIVLLLFLRSARSTLVIGLAIPTSIVGTFLVLGLLGRSLNVISLAGLAFAVGMLVDNAVVVLENIYRHRQEGREPFEAAIRGTKEVWGAVLASTLTTLAVFVPVLFVEEEAGQLFRDIALAVSAAVGLSLIVSVSLIPTTAARVLPKLEDAPADDGTPGLLQRFGSRFVDRVVGLNARLQKSVWRQVAVVVAFIGAAGLIAWALFPKVEYLPTGNRNLVIGIIIPPPGYNVDQQEAIGRDIEQRLEPYWNVEPDSPEALSLDGPPIGDFFYVAFGRTLFLGARTHDPARASELVGVMRRVVSGIPGCFGIAKQTSLFEQGLSAGRTIEMEITGPELPHLVALGGRLFGQAMAVVPGAQVRPIPSLDLSNPEVHVIPRWDRAADVGMTAADLGYTVDALVDGAYASDFYVDGERVDLSIVGRREFASRFQDLEDLPIATPSGDLVPLRAVANVRLASGPEQINRSERQRTITIEVSPPPQMALEDAMDRITEEIIEPLRAEGALSGAYQVHLAGTADKLRATWAALQFNILLALLITYLLMAALFESWLYPFVVILSVPLGAVGGFAGLRLLNVFVDQPLDVLTMLGFVILIGTVVNNAILIVHQSLNEMRERGAPPDHAILQAVRTRIRPIFMTTVTTVCGLLPLVVFPGAGSELYRGLGSVVLGGLVVSTVFTLVLIPSLFHLAMRAKAALTGRRD